MKLSIITVNRNNAGGLERTLQSTLGAQSGFNDYEQIVVDGASSDGSVSVLDGFRGHPRLSKTVSEPDGGIYEAMNKGARMASGDWLLFLNSGDLLVENVLARVFSLPFHAEIAYGDLFIGHAPEAPIRTYPDAEEISPVYFLHSYLPHPASFISSALFRRIGGYDERFRIAADTDFFLSAVRDGARLFHLPFPVARYDMGGVSNSPRKKVLQNREREMYLGRAFDRRTIDISLLGSQLEPFVPCGMSDLFASDLDFRKVVSVLPEWLGSLWQSHVGRAVLRKASVREARRIRAQSRRTFQAESRRQNEMIRSVCAKLSNLAGLSDPDAGMHGVESLVESFGPEETASAMMSFGVHFVADRFAALLPNRVPADSDRCAFAILAKGLCDTGSGDRIAATIRTIAPDARSVSVLTEQKPSADDELVQVPYRRVVLPRDQARRDSVLLSELRRKDSSVLFAVSPFCPQWFREILVARLAGFPVMFALNEPIWTLAEQNLNSLSLAACLFRLTNLVITPSEEHAKSVRHLGGNAVCATAVDSPERLLAAIRECSSDRGRERMNPSETPEGRMLAALVRMNSFGVSMSKLRLKDLRLPPQAALKRPESSNLPAKIPRAFFDFLNCVSWRLRQAADTLVRKFG